MVEFKIGEILNGKVIKMIKIGAFVDIGNNKVGFLHISEISNEYIQLPSDKLNINDIIKVKIISLNNDKVGLSIKQALNEKKYYKPKCEANENNFEDMMKKFKTTSEQKLSDLKKYMNVKQRRSKNNR